MVKRQPFFWFLYLTIILSVFSCSVQAEQAGSIRGIISDEDFDAPLSGAQVLIAETEQKAETAEQGNFLLNDIKPGTYTLVISKDGYTRQVKGNVVVVGGQMTEIESSLSGEFTEMEEFVVQDVQIGTGTEQALLDLRMESPALMDSVSSELMSQAGAGDAASALKLVAGATVQDGKYATVRGLPDRYVNSQLNGVRLPTADVDKRAVQLDQFPSSVIESIQVSKTFTPDQQGDASGGAVNIILKGIPDETFLKLEYGMGSNSQIKSDMLTNRTDGGVSFWGMKENNPQDNMTGDIGSQYANSAMDYKWSIAGGGKIDLTEDVRLGGLVNFYYNRDSSYYEGTEDKYCVDQDAFEDSGSGSLIMVPQSNQNAGRNGGDSGVGEWFTSLYDIQKSSVSVQWGGLGAVGIETDDHSVSFLYMYTHDATETITKGFDTRGKTTIFNYWPGTYSGQTNYGTYDPRPSGSEYGVPTLQRIESLVYTERTTETAQIHGQHRFDIPEIGLQDFLTFKEIEFDWTIADSMSRMYQPDKTLISSSWDEDSHEFVFFGSSASTTPDINRIWRDIRETSAQYFWNIKLPFEQWSGDTGYVKLGAFSDKVRRTYEKESFYYKSSDSFSSSGELTDESFPANIDDIALSPADDINYTGQQDITAWYYMGDIPLNSYFKFIGGIRYEQTKLSIANEPDSASALFVNANNKLISFNSAEADTDFQRNDALTSLGFEFEPLEKLILRGSYAETVARPTFKELTPTLQQEYVGADQFCGNPALEMSSLENYDLRLDYTPYQGGLFSASYFFKSVINPIEYRQIHTPDDIDFIRPYNYPEGQLKGWEFEIRQDLGHFSSNLRGLSLGGNATFIQSEVTLPDEEAQLLADSGVPEPTRDMMNAPEHLYNLYTTYNIEDTGTKLNLFYTVRGDTLIAGPYAGPANQKLKYDVGPPFVVWYENVPTYYIPSVYEKEYGTLNFSLVQQFGEDWKAKFQVKNILNPKIQTVYRSKYLAEDVVKTSYRKGVDYSITVSAQF